MTELERTAIAQQGFNLATGEIPVTVPKCWDESCYLPQGHAGPHAEQLDLLAVKNGAAMDPFADDTPIVASCDLENPESCESCQ